MNHHLLRGLPTALTLITSNLYAVAEPEPLPPTVARSIPGPSEGESILPRGTAGSTHRFGLELTPMSAIARIWAIHGTYSAWRYGDVMAGYVYQNEMIGDAGRAHGHTLAVGYRQFFWRGFNLEIEHWIAYNPIKSAVNGRTYKGWDGWLEVMPGYRWDFYRSGSVDFSVLGQVEFGWGTFRTNRPPKMPKSNTPFVMPLIWFGVRAF